VGCAAGEGCAVVMGLQEPYLAADLYWPGAAHMMDFLIATRQVSGLYCLARTAITISHPAAADSPAAAECAGHAHVCQI
jgi:hypothetical protein